MELGKNLSEFIDRLKGKQASSEAPVTVDKGFLLDKIRESRLFHDVPEPELEEMLKGMETISVSKGKTLVRQGDEGDYYYLLIEGAASITRDEGDGRKPRFLAEIAEPMGFGEEALISNQKRNATVTMVSSGKLMRLSKEVFGETVKKPLVDWLFTNDALNRVAAGAKWIDVRPADQIRADGLQGALEIPLDAIRDKVNELDKNTEYICYCQNGRLSSTAAFLLRQKGLKAAVLRGGLKALK